MKLRHILGQAYTIEDGVVASYKAWGRNTGHKGRVIYLGIIDGTDHLFVPSVLGPEVSCEGRMIATKWILGTGNDTGPFIDVPLLPEAVKQRYRLDGVDHITISIHPIGTIIQPKEIW